MKDNMMHFLPKIEEKDYEGFLAKFELGPEMRQDFLGYMIRTNNREDGIYILPLMDDRQAWKIVISGIVVHEGEGDDDELNIAKLQFAYPRYVS